MKLKITPIIFLILSLFLLTFISNFVYKARSIDNFNDLKISAVGKPSKLFPKKSKALSYKIPIERDKIEEVQKLDFDVVRYHYD